MKLGTLTTKTKSHLTSQTTKTKDFAYFGNKIKPMLKNLWTNKVHHQQTNDALTSAFSIILSNHFQKQLFCFCFYFLT